MDKKASLRPFVPNRAQLHFRANQTGRDIILKARQLGFSTEIQAAQFTEAITSTSLCATLAHDSDTTAKLRRMASRFYDHLPVHLRPARGLDNATTTTYPSTGSEVTIATAGSGNVGRGGTYTRVHGSEVAFWKDPDAIMAGILQGVSEGGKVILESTPNGAQGWFYERCMEALRGEGIWTLHFYQWWWDSSYTKPLTKDEALEYSKEETALIAKHGLSPEQIKWRRFKIKELGETLFLQEYPEDVLTCFLQSGGGVFTVSQSQIMPYPHTSPYAPEGAKHHNTYVMGIDWGQSDDSTVAVIFDATDYKEVAIYRKRHTSYESMISDIVDLAHFWQVEKIIPEKNSMGTPAIEMLFSEINKREWGKDPRTGYSSEPVIQAFTTTHKSKDDLVKLFIAGLESGLSLLPDEIANHELRAYQTKQTASGLWTYSAPDGGHDDTVIARLLANKASYEMR